MADTPQEEFLEAENTFRFQDYKSAEKILYRLLHPEVLLDDPEEVIKAREYLGACYFWLENEKRMDEEFTALFSRVPTYRIDPFYYPAALIDKVERLRARLEELNIIDTDSEGDEKEEESCLVPRETVVERSKWVSLVPFGVGQFYNGDNLKGALFLGSEVLTLGVNIGTYVAADRLRGDDGLYTASNAKTARRLQIVQYVSLGVLVGLAVWGIVDASLGLERETRSIEMVPCPVPGTGDPESGPGAPSADVGASLCLGFR